MRKKRNATVVKWSVENVGACQLEYGNDLSNDVSA